MKKIILAGLLVFALIGAVSAQQYGMMNNGQFTPVQGGYGGMMQMMGGYGGYGSGMMLLGWLTYLLFIALIIAAIYWLIKSANRKR